jgi:hypothetical protein
MYLYTTINTSRRYHRGGERRVHLMRRITKGRTVIAYLEYLLETSLAFRDLYELPGPGRRQWGRNMEDLKKKRRKKEGLPTIKADVP